MVGPNTFLRRALALAVLAAVLGAAWIAPLDTGAAAQAEAGLKRALASFATARTLNAVISVVQGTELAVQPAGLGVTFTPGQVLDPLNDLVEQFSTLMLAASVAFGVELALIRFGGYWAVSLLLSLLALAWAWSAWRDRPAHAVLTRLFLGVLLVRFAVPLVVLGSETVFQVFLKADYEDNQARVERSSTRISDLSVPVREPKADEALTDRLRRWWSEDLDVRRRIDELTSVAGRTVEHIVRLIVVFLLQTLLVPLLLLWGLLKLARTLLGAHPTGH